jgi:uncharacterized protein with GYD domain
MPTYVALIKLTDQGAKDIKNLPKRVKLAEKLMDKVGGKIKGFYLTMGEYDYVAIAEAPSDEVACAFLLGLGADGTLRTSTLKAFTLDEFSNIVKKLP